MTSGDAAEQVVKIVLDGAEVALRITGALSKNVIVALYALLNNREKTAGQTRMTSLLKSGKELKLYTIQASELKKFSEVAKQYGVLYTVVKDKESTSPNAEVDIWARMEDAPKIDRIAQKYGFGTVEMGSVTKVENPELTAPTESSGRSDSTDALLDELLGAEGQTNPFGGQKTEHDSPSGNFSDSPAADDRPSVRKELEDIRKDMSEKRQSPAEKALDAIEKMSKLKEEVSK